MVATWRVVAVVGLVVVGGGVVAVTQDAVDVPGVSQTGPERPTFGIEDMGDWGTVTEDETEIVHTLWVQNPNPAGVSIGDAVTISYQATINDIELARGEKSGIDVQPGNNTVAVRSYLSNDRIAPWWVNFITNDETLTYDVRSEATVRGGLSYQTELPRQRGEALSDSTPVETALDAMASEAEGRYTCTVGSTGADACRDRLFSSPLSGYRPGGYDGGVTVGFEVVEGSATWGAVTREETEILFDFQIENVGDVPIVADARHLGASVSLNGVELVQVTRDDHTVRGLDQSAVIKPGERRTVTYVVVMNNDNVDEWFTSHVRRDETTTVEAQLQLVFTTDAGDLSFRVPESGGIRYTCELQTGILEDEQNTTTNCGSGGTASVGPVDVELDETEGTTSTPTPTPTETPSDSAVDRPTRTAPPTPTPPPAPTEQSNPPDAAATASPTSGTAPLDVTFDGSGSTDPDDDIVEYVWRFDDRSSPRRGETVAHTFQTAGTYDVELTVVDADGARNTDTVTVTIGSRL